MRQFIYFVPGVKTLDIKSLDAIGLGHLHDGLPPECQEGTGPEGLSGVLCGYQVAPAPGQKRRTPRYKASEQTWTPGPAAHGKPRWWVGYWNGEKPTAVDLKRKRVIAGHDVALRDGGPWTIPIARSTTRGNTLPKLMQLGVDGSTWRPSELPEFLGLCVRADRAFDVQLQMHEAIEKDDDARVKLTWQEAMEIVTVALAVNHRVSAVEVSILQLVGDGEVWDVLGALCDWPALLNVLAERAGNVDAPETSLTVSGSGAV